MTTILDYYSRKDVQRALVNIAKNREIAVMFKDDNFGKRPDILQYENDVWELAKQGAISFHISEERWSNPLLLKPGMAKSQLDNLRIGWDLLIDIDSKNLEYSKVAANYIIEALKFHDIKTFSIKFSGNKGFHIGIPFESFPETISKEKIVLLFPEGIRVIASYLKDMIKEQLVKDVPDYAKNNKIVDIDTILISSRHMFRAPYSYHEKSGLVSVLVDPKKIFEFDKGEAKPENVKVSMKFLDNSEITYPEASRLILQAFDWNLKNEKKVEIRKPIKAFTGKAIKEDFFPPCVKIGLNGLEDGKKRFLFILNNFLRNIGYSSEEIEQIVKKWSKKNKENLRENYIQTQLRWHNKQRESILPPNCDNASYYKDVQLCKPDNFCKFIKNPVNYSLRKVKVFGKIYKKEE